MKNTMIAHMSSPGHTKSPSSNRDHIARLLIVPPMTHIDLLDWTSFDAAIELGYRTTMEGLEKARTLPVGVRLFVS